jgi:hypothetical protein
LKARDVFAAVAGRSGKRRNLLVMVVVLTLSVLAAIGSGASSAGADEGCPNEGIRIRQHATQVGDCRAFERVSPAEKGGGDIVAEGESITAAASGDGAVFESRLGFADTVGPGFAGRTTYLARRGLAGWSVHSITAQGRPEAIQVLPAGTHTEIFSPDLSTALVNAYDLPGATGAAPERRNLYLEDTATRALRTVSSSQRGNGEDPIQYWPFEFINGIELWGASDDLSHVTWQSPTQLLPAGTAPGYPQGEETFPYAFTISNVYTWDDGTLHLAGILPDGTVPPEGSNVEPENGFRGTISADGSRQSFLASPTPGMPKQLYLRIDHSRTDLISGSENPAFAEAAQNVHFEGMTPDGRHVFFDTNSQLLADDENTEPDLYRWTDGPEPFLTLISRDGEAVNEMSSVGGAFVGSSLDGGIVYYHSNGASLDVWEEGVGIRTINPFVPRSVGSGQGAFLNLSSTQPGFARVSQDGNWLTYIYKIANGEPAELHVYDREADTDTCISCPAGLPAAGGYPGQGAIDPELTTAGRISNIGFRPRFLTNDGQVFFTSEAALVPEDTNGVADVYEYDGPSGKLSLVTSGTGSEPMEFADASASGNDVFFVTRQQLAPSDHDEFVDLYDARVGGGFEEAETSLSEPCAGEACQPVSGAAAAPTIASGAATRGNVRQGRRPHCGKHRRRIRRHGKVRCVRKHQRRHAGADRGGHK